MSNHFLGGRLDEGNGSACRTRLTRDRICESALEVIDENGLEGLSMRTLASTLGVKASSLYYHFGSKDELMTGVTEFLYRTLGRPPSDGDWTEQVKGTFIQLRDFIQTHPNATSLLVRDLARSPVAKKRANVLLRLLGRAGLTPDASASLISNLVALLVGHSLLTVWMWDESLSGDGKVNKAQATDDPARTWVHRVFKLEDSELSDEYRTQMDSSGVLELSRDSVYLAGLEALISGFVKVSE